MLLMDCYNDCGSSGSGAIAFEGARSLNKAPVRPSPSRPVAPRSAGPPRAPRPPFLVYLPIGYTDTIPPLTGADPAATLIA